MAAHPHGSFKDCLVQAEGALHELMIGMRATVFVDQNGERVEYARASLPRLQAYVAHLRELVAGQSSRPHAYSFTTNKGI